jgi:hypothetical protein
MILRKMIVCVLILSAFIFLTGAGKLRGSMKEIHQLWSENQPREAFELILSANSSKDNLDIKNLIELTGVRTIEKILDGDSEEYAVFVDSGHLVLCKSDLSMRICDIETKLSFPISSVATLLEDNLGLIVNDSKYIYFLRSNDEQLTLLEYSLRAHTSRPLGNFNREEISTLYDPEQFQLQLVDRLGIPLKTYDLNDRKEYPENFQIKGRDLDGPFNLDLKREGRNVRINNNGKVYEIPFPGVEFELSKEFPNMLFCPLNMNAVIVRTDWYPGLYILFDLQKERAMKVYLPADIKLQAKNWFYDSGILYIWKERVNDSGLYRINFEEKITGDDLGKLIEEYNLAHGGVSEEENKSA